MTKIQSLKAVAGKETVYVDIDDEITGIIDKVQSAKGKVVALVLPKRAPVLQSIVNMKLLKRTADGAEKNLVLITSEAGLLPLAGSVGLYVASTPSSKPSVPDAPVGPADEPEDIDEPLNIVDGNQTEDFDPEEASGKTVGELAAASGGVPGADGADDSIDMTEDADETDGTDESAPNVPKPKKNSKLRVPNFDSFRKRLALGFVVAIVLVVGWIYAFIVLPHATITIHTDSSTITTNANLVLDTGAKAVVLESKAIPATAQSQPKTASQQADATGQQNNGAKAAGTVTVVNCTSDNSEVVLAAGRSLSAGGHTYILNQSIDLPDSASTKGACTKAHNSHNSASVTVTALKGGAEYNAASGTTFKFATTTSDTFGASEVSVTGSATGGTDDIIKIITQSDIDGATNKIAAADTSAVKQQLVAALQAKGLLPIATTFLAGAPSVSTSAKAGDAASNVSVTVITTYTMLGVQKADLQKLVVANVDSQIDKTRQVILDDGVANAKFTQATPGTATTANVAMEAKSVAGPQLDVKKLKTLLAGKKAGDVKGYIKKTPGVTSVDVHFSPVWVGVVPSNAQKVDIIIDKVGN